ncbi:MAG TPA: hypothetical protein VFB28_06500 [Terriglobales bacterium]|nr:hypothetical protein [Terriglobales bacterium]
MTRTAALLGIGLTVLSFASAAPWTHAQARQEALPDVAGIRPGMPAEEAYKLLKARNSSVQIGIGQMALPGFGEKPVVTEMRALIVDASAPETINVWLTTPPGKQVVFAVGRLLEYDPSQPLLRNKVAGSLHEKYGLETDTNPVLIYWAFDEQGRRPDPGRLKQLNCAGVAPANLNVAAPQGATFPAVSTLIYPLPPANACDGFVKVTAQLDGAAGQDQTYVRRITVLVWDLPLYRRAKEAYQAYLANSANAQSQAELEKAKQRTVPKF